MKPIDLSELKTLPLSNRPSKVQTEDFGACWEPGGTLGRFLKSLPRILAGRDMLEIIDDVCTAKRDGRTVVAAMGAHVIKVGLNPVVIDLIRRGIVTAIAMNGAGIIHDTEIALAGKTSEDVARSIGDGSFGMAAETAEFLTRAVRTAGERGIGLGTAVGRQILEDRLPHADKSLFAAAADRQIPATVHVAVGTDILHMHPGFDPTAAGGASHLDFRIFASVVSTLEKGVYLNIGSAVILPEIFLKALTLVRNLGHTVDRFTSVNMDFIKQYRPLTNVVHRPTANGGRGYNLVGHHEIMLPLLAAGIIERLASR